MFETDQEIEKLFPPKPKQYSIVIPVFNEKESLNTLLSEILAAMTPLTCVYEIIFVDDGSTDGSTDILKEFVVNLPEIVRVVVMENRVGQTLALKKGFHAAEGAVVISMDADLQNDPKDIPKLIEKIIQDYHCVCGWRKTRRDPFVKRLLSKLGNVSQRVLTGLKIHDISCTLRAYKRECVKHVPLEWEGQHRFIPLSLSQQGYKIGEIESNHRPRKFGQTKYKHSRSFRVISDFLKIIRNKS